MNSKFKRSYALLLFLMILLTSFFLIKKSKTPRPPPRTQVPEEQTLKEDFDFHAIGIKRGKPKPNADTRPWWAKCAEEKLTNNDCHTKYAGQRVTGYVDVDVTRTGGPFGLLLMAEEPVIWRLRVNPDVDLRKIVVAGQHAQSIMGRPEKAVLEVYTDEPSSCKDCFQGAPGFVSYDESSNQHVDVLRKIKELIGRHPISMQLMQDGTNFTIGSYVKEFKIKAFEAKQNLARCKALAESNKHLTNNFHLQKTERDKRFYTDALTKQKQEMVDLDCDKQR